MFFIICCKRENFDSDFGHFLAKHVLKIGLQVYVPQKSMVPQNIHRY